MRSLPVGFGENRMRFRKSHQARLKRRSRRGIGCVAPKRLGRDRLDRRKRIFDPVVEFMDEQAKVFFCTFYVGDIWRCAGDELHLTALIYHGCKDVVINALSQSRMRESDLATYRPFS